MAESRSDLTCIECGCPCDRVAYVGTQVHGDGSTSEYGKCVSCYDNVRSSHSRVSAGRIRSISGIRFGRRR